MFSTTCDHGTLDVSRRRKDDALALQHLPEPVIRALGATCTALQKASWQQEKELQKLFKLKQMLSPCQLGQKAEQRRECARHIKALHYHFDGASPSVFAAAIAVMDSALLKINSPVAGKYLSCFSTACFLIGSKWVEDQYAPSMESLTGLHHKQWKEVDLKRMEERVLQVLEWEIPRCTYLTFLDSIMKVVKQCRCSVLPSRQVIQKAQSCLMEEFTFMFTPAAVALGVADYCTPSLLDAGSMEKPGIIMALQDVVKVLDSELYEIDQLLKGDRGRQCRVPSWCCNPCFSKVFKHPSDRFLPDYRLHDIKEASSERESDPRLAAPSPLIFDLSSSISDLDYSEDESDDSMNSVTESSRTESSGGASSISAGTVNFEQDSLKKECNEQELEDDSGIDQDSGDQDSDEQQDSHYV